MQYAKDYAAAGVPLTYIGPSNEPDFSANYDSMTMSPAQMASVLDVLGPTVKNSGLSTQIYCCAATGWPNAGQYASAIEADPTALADTAVFTGHGYSGAPTSPLPGWTKQAWETEWSDLRRALGPAWDDGSDASGMTWAQHIHQGLTGANLSAFLYWWGSTTLGERRQRGPGARSTALGVRRPAGCGPSRTTAATSTPARYASARPAPTAAWTSERVQEHRRLGGGRGAQHRQQLRHDQLLDVEHRRHQRHRDPVPDQRLEQRRGAVGDQPVRRRVQRHDPGPLPGHLRRGQHRRRRGGGGSGGGSGGGGSGGGGTGGGEIHALGSGKCLDVSNNSTAPGTQLDIWDCNGGSNQIWTRSSSNQLTVYSGSSQLCLDAFGQTTAGTKVDVWSCNGGANQQWNVNANGTITGVQSGLCLDVTGASTADGALVELWTCNGGSNQQWALG